MNMLRDLQFGKHEELRDASRALFRFQEFLGS